MSTTTRSGLTVAGIVLVIAGVVAGIVLWFVAAAQYSDAVRSLAAAPVNCDTTLDFERSGTFTIYAETKGEVGDIDGDCDNDDRSYEGGSDTNLDLTLFDGEENEVDLQRDTDGSYDAAGRQGETLFRVEIEEPGEYTLRVQGDDADVVARVGVDPKDGLGVLRALAIIALVAGLVLGVLFVVLGRRRGPRGGTGTAPAEWAPSPYRAAPPYMPTPVAAPGSSPPWGAPRPGWGEPEPMPPPPSGGGWGEPGAAPPRRPPPGEWRPPSR